MNESTAEDRKNARTWPHVRCRRIEPHRGHVHVNEGPRGGCGLPEWCDGEGAGK